MRHLGQFGICVIVGLTSSAALAQTFTTGQSVYAAPNGGTKYWYSGCVVGVGRSNNSYQVECAGTTYWVNRDSIRTTPPVAEPDPMAPGQMIMPVITPSHPEAHVSAADSTSRSGGTAGRPAATARSATAAAGVDNATVMHRRIQQDNVDALSAKLVVGKYECRSGGQYTFSDLYITGTGSYRVEPGGSGAFTSSGGAINFTSGPYKGAYAQMVDSHTVGISSDGTHNLATQCER